jgi:predicted metalloendopeptidase
MESSCPKPNENFYLHVNKAWKDSPKNAVPEEYPDWGGFVKLADDQLVNQIELLKSLKDKASKTEEEIKIAAIWEASCNRFETWNNGGGDYSAIENELVILDNFLQNKDQDYITKIASYLHYTELNGIKNVLTFDKANDLENSEIVVLDFSCCGLSLPGREYYTEENFKEKRDLFRVHLEKVYRLVSDGKDSTFLDKNFVERVWNFEEKLAKCSMKREQCRLFDQYYTNTTLESLYQQINNLASLPAKEENYLEEERNFVLNQDQISNTGKFLETTYTLFEFRRILVENKVKYFGTSDSTETQPKDDQVTAYDGDNIRRVFALILDEKFLDEYKAFLQYKIIVSNCNFTTKDLNEEFFDFYSRKLNGQMKQKPDEKRSIQVVNTYAGEMMGKIYVSKYFPESAKNSVKNMIQKIFDIMKESIANSDWLTAPTKEKAFEKLQKINVKIGFPDIWKDYSLLDIQPGDSLSTISKKARKWALKVEFFDKLNSKKDRNEWGMTPQTVNAYFNPMLNEIVFPAAILQPPFYHQSVDTIDFDLSNINANLFQSVDMTVPVNFGGIGCVIAHELTHGYDDQGRKFDGDGNLSEWWSEEDKALFNAKADLMNNQTKKFKYIDPRDSKEYNINGNLCKGENLADLGGLSLGIQGLTKLLQESEVDEKAQEDYYKIFFLSWANIWKENCRPDRSINKLTNDPHAPHEFRGNMVSNIEKFHEIFGVKEGDEMFLPSDMRVKMW